MLSRQDTKKLIIDTMIAAGWTAPAKFQILSFWTTFCCKNNIYPDTYSYDTFLSEIYHDILNIIPPEKQHSETHNNELATSDAFDGFMCQYLV